MKTAKYELGMVLKDIVTGYKGVAMGVTFYFTGCIHYGLLSQKLNDKNRPEDYEWFDESRLERIGNNILTKKVKVATSGIFPNAPSL